jgi:protein-tyrosine phosphatase
MECQVCYTCARNYISSQEEFMAKCNRPIEQLHFIAPDTIVENAVLLGSYHSAVSEVYIKDCNIGQILVCCSHLPLFLANSSSPKDKLRYHRLPVLDCYSEDISIYLNNACDFIDYGLKQGVSTLVHCHGGVSRSASVVIAWLIRSKGMTYNDAYHYVKARRKTISPNKSFERQLRLWANKYIH